MAISMLDKIQVPVRCESPKCGKQAQITVGRLKGKAAIPCPVCGIEIGLKQYARAIDQQFDTATELDKQARQRGELIERLK